MDTLPDNPTRQDIADHLAHVRELVVARDGKVGYGKNVAHLRGEIARLEGLFNGHDG